MSMDKALWYEISGNTTVDIIDKVCQLEYGVLAADTGNIGMLENIRLPQRMGLAFYVHSIGDIDTVRSNGKLAKKLCYIIADDLKVWEQIKNGSEEKNGLIMKVNDREELDKVVELVVSSHPDIVIITFKDPTNIPLELILAVSQNSKCRIFKRVKDSRDGQVSLLTMEKGADGLVFSSNDIHEIIKMSEALKQSNTRKFDLQEAVVTNIKPAGMGSRICIDTTSELKQTEGMLLGSTSNGGLLTCSETHFLPYMNLRTFRVNAGGLHLYVWGPDDRAVYLSDLRAGSVVYAVDHTGNARIVTVGRIKMESRPLLYIECEINGIKINTFIQDDWHVRMFGSKGGILPSSEIRTGDRLLGYIDEPGRHVGLKINESLKEL